MTRPEQPVLDAISELVDWQIEEGQRRGDGPAPETTPEPSVEVPERSEYPVPLAEMRRYALDLPGGPWVLTTLD